MSELKLPKGWESIELDNLLQYVIGGDWGKEESYENNDFKLAYCIRGTEYRNWGKDKGKTAVLRKIKKSSLENRQLLENDILVEISGGSPDQPVGRTVIIDKSVLFFQRSVPKIHTNFLRLIRPIKNINAKYLNFFLKYFYATGKIIELQGGSNNLRNLKFQDFIKIKVPVAELSMQNQIVEKLDELFSELEAGIESFKKTLLQLRVYRQSVLKYAFEGRLTNPDLETGELPEGWKILKLKELGIWKGGGTPSKQLIKYWVKGTNLWVTSKDMKIGIINDTTHKITDEAIVNSSANRIGKGAILFVMRSGILRHTFPVAIAGKDLTVNQDLQTLSPNGLATSEFIYWYIKAYNNEIRQKCSKSGTTVESIESNSLKNYPFILPPLKEQQLIVDELESKLTVCDKIEETINHNLLQAESLRQSILKASFEGKLIS